MAEYEIKIDVLDSADIEREIIKRFEEKNPSKFNLLIPQLIRSLQIEKKEDERRAIFEDRLFSENQKILNI